MSIPTFPRLSEKPLAVSVTEEHRHPSVEPVAEAVKMLGDFMFSNVAFECMKCPMKRIMVDKDPLRQTTNVTIHCNARRDGFTRQCPDNWNFVEKGWVEEKVLEADLWLKPGDEPVIPTISREITNEPLKGRSHKTAKELTSEIRAEREKLWEEIITPPARPSSTERLEELKKHPVITAENDFSEWASASLSGTTPPIHKSMTMPTVEWPSPGVGSMRDFEREYLNHFDSPSPTKSNDIPSTTIGETW